MLPIVHLIKFNMELSTYQCIMIKLLFLLKLLIKKGINLTIGFEYRRFSPTHGTATDIKFKNIS